MWIHVVCMNVSLWVYVFLDKNKSLVIKMSSNAFMKMV